MKKIFTLSLLGAMFSLPGFAQNVFPGKEKINDKDYFGLNLNSNIAEKQLEGFWEDYLKTFGKTNSRRSVYTVDRADIPAISSEPVEIVSQVSSARNLSHVFMAMKVGDRFVSNFTDSTYKATEIFLSDFSAYAVAREEVRLAEGLYGDAEKNHKSLERDNEKITKEIERTQKKLTELMQDQETNKKDLAGSVVDLESKQKDVEVAKGKVPKM